MAQAFVTTYQNCYRYTAQPRTPLISPEKVYKVCYGKDEDWYKAATIDKTDIGDFQKIEQAVKNLNIKRMSSSTYRVDYCRDWKPKGIVEDSDKPKEETEFQLLDTFKPTYRKDKDKIKLVPPVQTTRTNGEDEDEGDNDADYFYCTELFSASPAQEFWVRCCNCLKWAHEV